MSLDRSLSYQVKKKEREIKSLRDKRESIVNELEKIDLEITAAESYKEGLDQALTMVKAEENSEPREFELREGTELYRVRQILLEANKPLNIKSIITKLGLEVTKAKRQSLTGSLGRLVRDKNIFYRSAPGFFALLEWDDRVLSDEDDLEDDDLEDDDLEDDDLSFM